MDNWQSANILGEGELLLLFCSLVFSNFSDSEYEFLIN